MLIAPPWIPYAPGLCWQGLALNRVLMVRVRQPPEALWAMEETLRSGACAGVIAWVGTTATQRAGHSLLQRLHLLAGKQQAWAVLIRAARCRRERSPARLRLQLLCSIAGHAAARDLQEWLARRGDSHRRTPVLEQKVAYHCHGTFPESAGPYQTRELGALLPAAAYPAAGQPLPGTPAQLWLCLYLPQLPLEARATQTGSEGAAGDLRRGGTPDTHRHRECAGCCPGSAARHARQFSPGAGAGAGARDPQRAARNAPHWPGWPAGLASSRRP